MRWRSWAVLAVVIGGFLAIDTNLWWLFRRVAADTRGLERAIWVGVLGYLPAFLVVVALTALVTGPRRVMAALGLCAPGLRTLGFVLACTAPLPLVYGLAGKWEGGPGAVPDLLRFALFPGIMEEILYRGFLFGLIYRVVGWGFVPTALLCAAVFATGHLYQSRDPLEMAMIVGVTVVAGVWWAWLYVRWGFDLWVPIGFHVLMNGWFVVFDVGDRAAGTVLSVGVRLAVVILSVVLTLRLRPLR